MGIPRRPEGRTHLLRQQADESGGAKLHNHGKGSFGGGARLPEVPPLPVGLPGGLPHGSQLLEVPS